MGNFTEQWQAFVLYFLAFMKIRMSSCLLSRDPAPVPAPALAPAPDPASASAPAPVLAPAPVDHDHEYNPDEFDYSSEEVETSDDEGPPTLRVKRSDDDNDTEASEAPTLSKHSDDDNDGENSEAPTWSKRSDDDDGEVVGDNYFEDNNDYSDTNSTYSDSGDWGSDYEHEDSPHDNISSDDFRPGPPGHTSQITEDSDHTYNHHHHRRRRWHGMITSFVKMPTSKKKDKWITVPDKILRNWKCGKDETRLIKLYPHGKRGSREYHLVADQMKRTKKDHPSGKFRRYNIIKIEKAINGCFWERYKKRQRFIFNEAGYRNERMLFHGSSAVTELLKHGFDERYANVAGMFGAGVYFARHSSKCNQYAFGMMKPCPTHGDKNCDICVRKMLLCRVTMGKVKKETQANNRPHAPPGYHSVHGMASHGGLKYDEYIVYRGEQVYPEYVITYKIVK